MSKAKETKRLFGTKKTMCDWFFENGVSLISIDYDYQEHPKGVYLQGVYAVIKQNGNVNFKAWDEDGNPWVCDMGEDLFGADAIFFAECVRKLTDILRKPYPINK